MVVLCIKMNVITCLYYSVRPKMCLNMFLCTKKYFEKSVHYVTLRNAHDHIGSNSYTEALITAQT